MHSYHLSGVPVYGCVTVGQLDCVHVNRRPFATVSAGSHDRTACVEETQPENESYLKGVLNIKKHHITHSTLTSNVVSSK